MDILVRFKELHFCTDIDKLSKLFPGAGCSAAPASECMRTALLTVGAGTPFNKREGSLGCSGGTLQWISEIISSFEGKELRCSRCAIGAGLTACSGRDQEPC